jgi:hypothetical protein
MNRTTNAGGQFCTRRRFMQIGGLGYLGQNLANVPRADAVGASTAVKSCIVIFYYGGPSHLDTWDLKPQAPQGSS